MIEFDMRSETPDVIADPPSTGAYTPPRTLGPNEFQALLVELLPAAYGYALRLTRNRADAEDLVQDAALQAFRGAAGFEIGHAGHHAASFTGAPISCTSTKARSGGGKGAAFAAA